MNFAVLLLSVKLLLLSQGCFSSTGKLQTLTHFQGIFYLPQEVNILEKNTIYAVYVLPAYFQRIREGNVFTLSVHEGVRFDTVIPPKTDSPYSGAQYSKPPPLPYFYFHENYIILPQPHLEFFCLRIVSTIKIFNPMLVCKGFNTWFYIETRYSVSNLFL